MTEFETQPMLESPISADMRSWARNQGVELSYEGLVLPDLDQGVLDHKIAGSLPEVADRITEARAAGLDVIYLPGSYDLVHVGHLSYVDQVTKHYIAEAAKLGRDVSRDDLYLVMLADDDTLLEQVKASKFIGNGGSELFRRPVERGLDEHGRSPRLDALASFPVDCVGFIPSPSAEDLPAPYDLDLAQCREIAASLIPGEKLDHYIEILDAYARLEELYSNHQKLENAPWRVAAWQLYVTLDIVKPNPKDLGIEPEPYTGKSVTRVVSASDDSYIWAVKMINRWSDVGVSVIDDEMVVSTSGLLKQFGPETLLKHKAAALNSREN